MVVSPLRPDTGPAPDGVARIGPGAFARLKLRIFRNGFRGSSARVWLWILGALAGLSLGIIGFAVFAVAVGSGDSTTSVLVPAIGGSALVLGWLLLPLVWFGVDDTLDPARFALLPIRRGALLRGLLVGALIGVPAAATLLATSGLVVGAAVDGGPLPALVAAVGVLLGLLQCVCLSRAVTSAFSRALRARRTRDLAAVVLAVLAASIGPLQFALTSGAARIGVDRFTAAAEVLGWTPLGAPYLIGVDAIAGDWLAVLGRLAIVGAGIAVLTWWWSTSLESAMIGGANDGNAAPAAGPLGSPVARLFGRSRRPRTAYGAMVSRELRYWVRDARRRANMITFVVVGIFVPVVLNLGPSDTQGASEFVTGYGLQAVGLVFIGGLATVGLANQFGFDGTAYATQLIIGVPGRTELRSRVVAYSWFVAPVLVLAAILVTVLRRDPAVLPVAFGVLAASYGCGLACCLHISVLGAYSLPESQNPFAISTGAGVAKSLLAMVAWIGGMALSAPVLLLVVLGGTVGLTLALPVGLAYGIGAIWLGLITAGDVLDRQQPELLLAINPRR
jgi:ABC-2 type transport system permease protein